MTTFEIFKQDYSSLPTCTAYVDGSFIDGMYGGGYCVFSPDGKLIYQDCGIGIVDSELLSMRNISGEMMAAMRATNWIDTNVGRGVIVHDYIGLSKWVTGEWDTQKQYTQMYADYMKPFYILDIIKFEWVKGHSKVDGNEIADKLAKQAIIHKQTWKY